MRCNVPVGWDTVTIRDVLADKGYIRGPFGSALRRGELKTSGIPVYEQQHAIYGDRVFRFFIDADKYQELKRFTVAEGDIIISCSGTIGRASIIQKDDPIGIISQALLILRCDPQKITNNYLFFFISSDDGYNAITSRSSGSVQVNIAKREIIEKIPLLRPPLPEQRAIAATLSCLDDKIENNNRICKTLEDTAQAIFKRWFVEFEFSDENGNPYKSSGGEMVDSELGKIPKGWRVARLVDIADFINGLAMQRYPLIDVNDIGLPVLKIKELNQGKTDINSDVCSQSISSEYIALDGDVIFSWSGSLMTKIWVGGKAGLNQHLFKVTSKQYEKWFYYLWIQNHMDDFIQIAKGKATTMGHIQRKHLGMAHVLIPDGLSLQRMSKVLKPTIDAIIAKGIQSRTLTSLRNALLPKLMSGEIRVPVEAGYDG